MATSSVTHLFEGTGKKGEMCRHQRAFNTANKFASMSLPYITEEKCLYIQEDGGMLLFVTMICGLLAGCQSSESAGGRRGSVGIVV